MSSGRTDISQKFWMLISKKSRSQQTSKNAKWEHRKNPESTILAGMSLGRENFLHSSFKMHSQKKHSTANLQQT